MNPSVMNHQFSQVPNVEMQRSKFNRSHGIKTTFDAGYLIPILVDEALPGDTFNVKMTGFGRLATPLFPVMDNIYMDTFFFSVPNRLLWDNWQRFCGEQTNPDDSIDFTIPIGTATGAGAQENTIFDYMGLPPEGIIDYDFNILPFRAYNLIWNEWFRDQNLQDSLTVDTGDGPANLADFTLQRRGKRHDYFTSCLPWPQKGESVDMPIGASAPVAFTSDTDGQTLGVFSTDQDAYVAMDIPTTSVSADFGTTVPFAGGQLYADLSSATAATINQLRQAFQIQKLQERDARGGTRYTEVIRSHFGVTSPDARLQRPEFLGGGSSPININPVPQTSETDGSPQGNLAAFGTVSLHNHGFTKSFTEHCTIIGLISVRADLTYQQGLNRMWSRSTRYDYYWPSLANIGEQAVLNQEIYTQGTAADQDVFGYQERYGEYRYKPSTITGLFRSSAAASLDAWHLSQEFDSLPALNASFIEDNPPIDRVIAVPAEPHILFDGFFSMMCARPMPLYGVPGQIDRF